MGRHGRTVTLLAALAWTGAAGAEDAPSADSGCKHTIVTMPKEVRTLLLPTYEGTAKADLPALALNLRAIQAEVESCRDAYGDPSYHSPKKQEELADWRSLEEWVDRLAVLINLEHEGKPTVSWREEFKIFADLFEIPL